LSTKDPRIDTYISEAAPFAQPILKHLRKVIHAAAPKEMVETIKWNFPHFEYQGILCSMAAFKRHCALIFWKGPLIFEGAEKESEAMGQFGRLTSVDDLPEEKTLASYIRKAAELNAAGVKSPARAQSDKKAATLEVPDYLTAALAANAKAKKTWDAFSYSCRKEYVEWLTDAKREETRRKRLATTLEWLAEGKSQNWRYERK
jgi:uncharacterized protein YdeI (YjbR/CyaY-like superfamily)